ncbi:nitrous oxide-stimulated promoter family protein [Anaerococcus sp.]|uniref:nitrous oxide-stimulated promoter family protein n=1 Tax=Anaerococcus sp. TaxID=1872515 RepID=UPI0027B9E1CF|nr:nitrous oxide-stimulated promoter family protein [Anaerococcus sp.]
MSLRITLEGGFLLAHMVLISPSVLYCKIHCYEPARREEIREVMRFSGPRFNFYRPGKSIKHLLYKTSFIRKLASKKSYRK